MAVDLKGPLMGVLALAGCGVFAATLVPVPDHAYQFFQAERILDGARMYVDVGAADMHPPLFTWLAVAIAWLGRILGVSGLTIYPAFVFVAATASLAACWRLGLSSGWLLTVLVLALLPMAGPYYGQGEHLALILSLPYLTATAKAVDGGSLRPRAALAVGLAAAFGLAMKPYFALVWLGAECYLAARRGKRSFLRLESITIAVAFASYVIATALVTPEFFTLLPWLAQLYPQIARKSMQSLLLDRTVLLLASGIVAAFIIRGDGRNTHLSRVLSIAAIAMYAAVLLQGKGWGYHWYPVRAIAVALWGVALIPLAGRWVIPLPALAVAAVVWMQAQAERTTALLVNDPTELPRMIEAVERHAGGESIVALSFYLHVAFPLVNLTDVGWASPYGHLWMIAAMYARAPYGPDGFLYREAGEWQELEQEMFDRLWETIEREDPAITILDGPQRSGFDIRAYFDTDPRFRDRLARSPVLDTIGRYIVLGRPEPG